MSAREEYLEAENAHLRERLADLTGQPKVVLLQRALGLTKKQAALLALLWASPNTVSRRAIYSEVFEHADGDGPNDPIIAVVMSKLRRRLEAWKAPGRIETIYRSGYTMSPDLRAWVSERVSA